MWGHTWENRGERGQRQGYFSSTNVCVCVYVYMYNYNKCFKNYNLKRFLLEVVFTLVMASLLTAIGGIQWTNSTATLFMQCVYITPRAIHTECLPHHYPSFHLNSNYRCVIYLPPLVFSQWDTVAINFSRSCSENWRRESEKWLQKEAFFTLNQS